MLAIVAISYALYKSSTEIHELKTSSTTWCCGEMVRPLWGRDLVGCLGLIWDILSRRSVWKKLAFFFLIFHYTHASVLYEELFYTIIYCMISYSFFFLILSQVNGSLLPQSFAMIYCATIGSMQLSQVGHGLKQNWGKINLSFLRGDYLRYLL